MCHEDITPNAVDTLLADLSLMLATEEAVAKIRGPIAHVQTGCTRHKLSVPQVGGFAFPWCGKGGMCCVFNVVDLSKMLAALRAALVRAEL